MAKMHYWTPETETALIEFNETEDAQARNQIYNERLHAPFSKLVECIVNRFTFQYIQENVCDDALMFLVSKAHYFKKAKGEGKSFGYCSLIVKNYLIQLNDVSYKALSRDVPLVKEDDDEGGNYEIERLLSYEDVLPEVVEFDFKGFAMYWQERYAAKYEKPDYRLTATAFAQLLMDCPEDIKPKARGKGAAKSHGGMIASKTGITYRRVHQILKIMRADIKEAFEDFSNGIESALRRREKKKGAILTRDQVKAIRQEFMDGGELPAIARNYQISDKCIGRIVDGTTWGYSPLRTPKALLVVT